MKKKFFNYAIAATLVVAGVSFVACSSDDDVIAAIDQPSTSGGKTSIAFAVPVSGSATRMVDLETQVNNTFGGISGINFWAVRETLAQGALATKAATIESKIAGFTEGITGFSANGGGANTNGGVKVFKNLTLPTTDYTNIRYIFYGENTNAASANQLLLTAPATGQTLEKVQFSLTPRVAGDVSALTTALQNMLNEMAANKEAATTAKGAAGATPADVEKATLTEAAYTEMLTTLKNTAKSASLEGIDYILNYINKQYGSMALPPVTTAFADLTEADGNLVKLNSTFRDFLGSLPRGLCALAITESAGTPATYTVAISTRTDGLGGFASAGAGTTSYTYAPSLWYYGNGWLTKQTVADGEAPAKWEGTNPYYNNDATIANPVTDPDLAYSHAINYGNALLKVNVKNNISVQPIVYEGGAYLTASGAATDPVDVVKCGGAILKGYRWKGYTTSGSDITPNTELINATDFYFTGILVGSQPNKVGYDFTQESLEIAPAVKAVYDNDIELPSSPVTVTTAYGSSYTYDKAKSLPVNDGGNTSTTMINTLLLESASATAATLPLTEVNFALEFVNNSGKTFVGNNSEVVTPGATFYLTGKITWKGNATNTDITKIFQQDYTTVANITIGALKAMGTTTAPIYTTVPDLQVTQHSVAMYVDVVWQEGFNYDITLGE